MQQHEAARYAEVLSFPSAAQLRRRLPPLLVGIVALGLSISCSVHAELGLAPWDVFHQGISETTGAPFGVVVVAVGVVVLLTWIPLHRRAGLGTIINTLTVGLIADLGLWAIPEQEHLPTRIVLLAVGLVGFGVAGGLYIGAALGPGPRDGLMTALSARGHRLWVVRTVMEVTVLVVGFVLGGSVGAGTIVLALGLGPINHLALRHFHLPVGDEAPEVLGE